MQLHKEIDKFYLSILDYAGLEYDETINNKNKQIGEFTITDKKITLPYLSNLKNPNGRHIFHLLNESYVKPENPIFNLYKKRLICEINLKLSNLITTLANIASSLELQSKIKNIKLIEIISEFKEVDMLFIENLLKIMKVSKDKNDEGFIIDIYIKKNGEIDNIPYSATGKVMFTLYEEVKKVLEDTSKEYRIYGYKARKKDLITLYTILNILFPNIEDKNAYVEKTDNKVFRCLNILLTTSYMITSRINELSKLIESISDNTINMVDLSFNTDWVSSLDTIYTLTNQIRLIPNQVDISSVETPTVHHVNSNEQLIQNNTQQVVTTTQTPIYNPINNNMQQPPQTTNQPQDIDPLDILKRINNNPYGYQPVPMQQPMYIQQPTPNPTQTPMWMQQEMRSQQQPMYQQQPQPMYQPPQQPMGQQVVYDQQGRPMIYDQQGRLVYAQVNQPMQQSSILNPQIIGRAPGNF